MGKSVRIYLVQVLAAVLLVLMPAASALPGLAAALSHAPTASSQLPRKEQPAKKAPASEQQLNVADQGMMPPALKLPQALPPLFFQRISIPLPAVAMRLVQALPRAPGLAIHKSWIRVLFRTTILVNAP